MVSSLALPWRPYLKLLYKIGSFWSEILMRTDWTITIGLHEVSQVQHGDTFSCYLLFSFSCSSSKFSPRKGCGRGICIPVMLLRTDTYHYTLWIRIFWGMGRIVLIKKSPMLMILIQFAPAGQHCIIRTFTYMRGYLRYKCEVMRCSQSPPPPSPTNTRNFHDFVHAHNYLSHLRYLNILKYILELTYRKIFVPLD